jgi:hypothetical protein
MKKYDDDLSERLAYWFDEQGAELVDVINALTKNLALSIVRFVKDDAADEVIDSLRQSIDRLRQVPEAELERHKFH